MFNLLASNASLYLSGIEITIFLTTLSALCGLIMAVIITYAYLADKSLVKPIINGYLFLVRGTPFLLQLFIIYYGSMQFHWISHSILSSLFKSAYNCALIALTINTSAYTSVFLIKAFEDFDHKQILAANNLGLSKLQIILKIIAPQILMQSIPLYSNEIIMLIKCTAITSSITILDIMGVTQQIIGMTYQTIPCLLIAAVIYLMLNMIIVLPSKLAYKKYCQKINIA
jgi:His/Glu/Gln/Arg/opine family amino acid ABC transporter permease subunit